MFDKISDPKDVILKEGQVPIRHRYTPGVAGEVFFKALRDRATFLASRCTDCGMRYCPPRLFCERCFEGPLEADLEVGPEGTVESFSVGYTGLEGEVLAEPVTIGLIRLDGADTVLVHFLIDTDQLMIGQRVQPAFQPKGKRTGSILDLRGFRPAD